MSSTMTDEAVEALGEDALLFETLRTARAIRRLKPDPVPKALIQKVCEAGIFAPSGGNRQPWIFVAVTEPERRAFIAERYREAFHAYIAPAFEKAEADPDFPAATLRNMKAALHLADHIHDAPVHLVVAGWKRRGGEQTQALFPAIQNILLACRAVGLGASLTSVHLAHGREIDAYLGLSEKTPSCALIPIGWPLGKHGVPPREPIETKLHWERFDDHGS
jgi:nitroreductase